jgi:hypothetical protein
MSYFKIFDNLLPKKFELHKFLSNEELFQHAYFFDVIFVGYNYLSLETAYLLALNNFSVLILDDGARDYLPKIIKRNQLKYKSVYFFLTGAIFEGKVIEEVFVERQGLTTDLELLARDEGAFILRDVEVEFKSGSETGPKLEVRLGNATKELNCKVLIVCSLACGVPESLFDVWYYKKKDSEDSILSQICRNRIVLVYPVEVVEFSKEKAPDFQKCLNFREKAYSVFFRFKQCLIPRIGDSLGVFKSILNHLPIERDIYYSWPEWLPLSKIILEKRASETHEMLLKLMGTDLEAFSIPSWQ